MIVNLLLGLNTESTVVWAHNNNNRFVILKDFLKNEEVFSFSVYFFRIQFLVTKSGQNLISVSSSGTRVDKIRSPCPVRGQEWTKSDLRVQFGNKSGQNLISVSSSGTRVDRIKRFCPLLKNFRRGYLHLQLFFRWSKVLILYSVFILDYA